MTAGGRCPTCDRPLDTHDRHIRFTLPDPVLDTTGRVRAPGTWMNDVDARTSVMLQVPGVGAFVRALVPVRLTGGFAAVRDVEHTPYCTDSPDEQLSAVLSREWPHAGLLDAVDAD